MTKKLRIWGLVQDRLSPVFALQQIKKTRFTAVKFAKCNSTPIVHTVSTSVEEKHG